MIYILLTFFLYNLTIKDVSLSVTNSKHFKDDSSPSKKGREERRNSDKILKKAVFKVVLKLSNGMILKGDLILDKNFSFEIVHRKDGIFYKKKIYLRNVRKIKVLEWKYILVNKDENKGRYFYKFVPLKILIILKDGKKFIYDGYIDAFLKFFFTNSDGTAIMYMMFYDEYDIINSFWINAKKKGFFYHKKNGLFTSVEEMKFL